MFKLYSRIWKKIDITGRPYTILMMSKFVNIKFQAYKVSHSMKSTIKSIYYVYFFPNQNYKDINPEAL